MEGQKYCAERAFKAFYQSQPWVLQPQQDEASTCSLQAAADLIVFVCNQSLAILNIKLPTDHTGYSDVICTHVSCICCSLKAGAIMKYN